MFAINADEELNSIFFYLLYSEFAIRCLLSIFFYLLMCFLYQYRSSLSPISFIWHTPHFFQSASSYLTSDFLLLLLISPLFLSVSLVLFLFYCISCFSSLSLLSFRLSIILFLFICISWSLHLSSLSSFSVFLFLFHCISSRYKKPFRGSFKCSPPRWNSLWMAPSALNYRVNINDFHLPVFRSAAACP